jgi:hypothetical protein
VDVDPVSVEPMFVLMHELGVETYGRAHFCDYIVDARGTYVSDPSAEGCDRLSADGRTVEVFDAQATQERAALLAQEQALGLPRMHVISVVYDEQGRLKWAAFDVDSCVAYNFEPAAPMDLSQPSPSGRGSSPWTTLDVCAGED